MEREDRKYPDGFEGRQTRYFQDFANRYRSAFYVLHSEQQVLKHWIGLEINGHKTRVENDKRKIHKHSVVCGALGEILIDVINENNGQIISPADKKDTVSALIIHDGLKWDEIDALNKALQNGGITPELLLEIKEKERKKLREFGVPERVIDLSGANTPKSPIGPQTLEEEIVWMIDASVSNTDPVPVPVRFERQRIGWDGTSPNPERARRNCIVDEIFREVLGETLTETQLNIHERVSVHLSELSGFSQNPYFFPLFLKAKFEERVNAVNLASK